MKPTTYRYERIRRLSKEGSWILIGQAAGVAGAVVGVRVLTELLAPAEYGEVALALTAATFVNQTVLGPLGNGIIRFYAPAVEQGDLGGYLKSVARLVGRASALIAVLIPLAVVGLVVSRRPGLVPISIAVFVLAILGGGNSILSGLQNAARQRAIVALHQALEPWARFLVAAGLLLWLGRTSTFAVVGQSLGVLLVVGSQLVFFRRTIAQSSAASDKGKDWEEAVWRYSWPFAAWGVFYWVQSASDRWALALFADKAVVGLYAVLFQLGYYPISLLTGMATQLLAPIFYQRAGDASDAQRNASVNKLSWNLTWTIVGVSLVAFLLALLLHQHIFHILVAEKYGSMSHLLPWMLLSGGLFAAGQAIALSLMSQMKTRAMMVAKIATATLGVAFNFAGAYWLGIEGIVAASLLFSAIYFLWMMLLARQLRPGFGDRETKAHGA